MDGPAAGIPHAARRPLPPPEGASYGTELQRNVRTWIVENETLALLAGFAFGVFVGTLMRD